jgi:hypothetical protein
MQEVAEAHWDALLPPGAPPFVRHAFLDALERTGCVGQDTGWTPAHLLFEDDGKLIAACPAYRKAQGDGEFALDDIWAALARTMGVCYYPKLVIAVPFTPATGPRLIGDRARALPALRRLLERWLRAGKVSGAHVLYCSETEMDELALERLEPRYGVQFQWHNQGYGSFDDWLATFDAKHRHQIRRERRDVARQGIAVETLRGADVTEGVLDTVYGFYAAGLDKHDEGPPRLSRLFLSEIARRMPGTIEVVLAREQRRLVGGALNFASKDVLYGRYWGCTEEHRFLHFEVCYYHSVEQCIARGIRRFEPGAGGDFKRVRGFRPTRTFSAHRLADPRLEAAVRRYIAEERELVIKYVPVTADT